MKPEKQIEELSESMLKTIDSSACLTTKEEENIFHQGFYSGYRQCEKETFTKEEIQFVLDGFTKEAYGGYIKTNFVELLEKFREWKLKNK